MNNPSPSVEQTLKTYFGFSEFRLGQRQVIDQILARKSSVAVFPTGSGKSLCYQLPALLLPGLTLVVSPLLALMKDQIDSLHAKGIKAARLDSTLSNSEYQDSMRDVREGKIKILYVAPERFMNERFRNAMKGISISLFSVDEAHCVSEWGHNFRPDYLKLAQFAQSFEAECILALTATATPEVLDDICKSFDIDHSHAVVTGFYRPNLTLLSMPVESSKRDEFLLSDLRSNPRGPTIIYVTLQKTAEKIALMLSEHGIQAQFYHAGMSPEDRTATQNSFIGSDAGIVVATIAFGMGIDKANIRYVYHYNLPKSLENYSQEIGRAGRDGKPSLCKLYACPDDLNTLENFVYGDKPSKKAIEELIAAIFQEEKVFDISLYEASTRFDIRTLVLSTLMTYFELQGFLKADTPYYQDYQFKTLVPWAEILAPLNQQRQDFLNSLLRFTKKGSKWFTLDVERAIKDLNETRDRIVSALNWLAEKQSIELKVANIRNPYSILKKPSSNRDLAERIYLDVDRREKKELGRISAIIDWSVLESCQTNALARYFGEDRAEDCGHCTHCLGISNKMLPQRNHTAPEKISEIINKAQGLILEYPQFKIEPVSMTRFLCGISSPRLMRSALGSKHPYFGILSDTPFEIVLTRLQVGSEN